MGWQSDWLYQLVFAEVERVWHSATRDGDSEFGPAPEALLVRESAEADWGQVRCCGPARRQWTFRGGPPEQLVGGVPEAADLGERRGMFYRRGLVEFCVATDRQQVLLTYTLGPRYGRGVVLAVSGQGASGRLTPGGVSWKS
jgi:hypothetical protein